MKKWLMADSKWVSAYAGMGPLKGRFAFRASVPRKHPAPVLVADKPWESMSIGWHTLLHDGGRYRMWYECRDRNQTLDFDGRLCYAESDDLIHWRKPELGLFEYEGSKRNNIVFDATMGHGYGLRGHSICRAPTNDTKHADDESRVTNNDATSYRMIYAGYDGAKSGIMTARSTDGIRWKVATKSAFRYRNHTQNVAFWAPELGKYVGFFRIMETPPRSAPEKKVGCIARAETGDFDVWPQPVTVRTPDERDGPETDFYNNSACRYESGGDVLYLMFCSMFHHDTNTCDVELMTSRDSKHWQRFDRRKVIQNDWEGWGAGMIFAGPTIVPFGEGLAISYGGDYSRHSEANLQKISYEGGIGIAQYPMDRFQGLWTEDLEATLAAFEPASGGERLRLNAIIEPGGEIRGALMRQGRPLPGCGFEDCQPITGDVLGGELKWIGAAALEQFRAQTLALRLRIHKATLYAIELG